MKVKLGIILGLSVMAGALLVGCASDPSTTTGTKGTGTVTGTVTADGSSALYPFATFLGDNFKKANTGVSMTINAGGSGTGLKDVAAGSVNIGMSDVYANEKLTPELSKTLVDHKVCTVGVGVVANKDVSIKNLTKDQLKSIFNGTVNNWKTLGGPDEKIVIINRPKSSGTRALFAKWALDGATIVEGDTSLQTDDSSQLSQTVQQTKGAIGYLALSYLNGDASSKFDILSLDGVAPTNDNIYNATYPVWGYEHMYTKGEATGAVKAYIDYANDKTMIQQYESMGYGSISKLNSKASASR